MKPSKESFKNWLLEFCRSKQNVKILDLGSGTSNVFIELIDKIPVLEYVGIEPFKKSYDIAKENLVKFDKRVRLYNQSAYEVKEIAEEFFDIVCSLSVVEHVKYLGKFLDFSAQKVQKDGMVIHLWDNAHELMSSSLKESIQCSLSNNFPLVIPELKFARAVYSNEVCKVLTSNGLKIDRVEYYHLRSTLSLIKKFKSGMSIGDVSHINNYEQFIKSRLDQSEFEKEFMTIAVFAKK